MGGLFPGTAGYAEPCFFDAGRTFARMGFPNWTYLESNGIILRVLPRMPWL